MENNNYGSLENDSTYQEFSEKDVYKTVLKSLKSTVKSSNKIMKIQFNKSYIALRRRKNKYYFFGQGEKLGIEFIEKFNNNENDIYQNYFFNEENLISKIIILESIENYKIYIHIKIYNDYIQLSMEHFELNEKNNNFINDENVKFIYTFKKILYSLSMSYSPVKNSKNKIYKKVDIKIYFPEKNEYCSVFGSELLKIIDEYKFKRYNINQIVRDILIKGYYFILLLEKIKKYGMPKEEVNYASILLEEYIDKYITERESNGLISEINNYYDNKEADNLMTIDSNRKSYKVIILEMVPFNDNETGE
jgi:hypothetical protein